MRIISNCGFFIKILDRRRLTLSVFLSFQFLLNILLKLYPIYSIFCIVLSVLLYHFLSLFDKYFNYNMDNLFKI